MTFIAYLTHFLLISNQSKIPTESPQAHGDSSQSPYPSHTHTHGNPHGNPHTHGSPGRPTTERHNDTTERRNGNGMVETRHIAAADNFSTGNDMDCNYVLTCSFNFMNDECIAKLKKINRCHVLLTRCVPVLNYYSNSY